jgi:hypothetical protein
MAPGWERWRAQLADALTPVREWLIRQLGPQPGETVLELQMGGAARRNLNARPPATGPARAGKGMCGRRRVRAGPPTRGERR